MVSADVSVSASERLHRWKDQVRRKQSMQLAEETERKRQEDNYFVAMRSRVMSIERVQLAAERNYEVAQQIERKKIQLRTRRERELLSEDECTFQPQLFVPTRAKLTRVRSRYRDESSRAGSEMKDKDVVAVNKAKPRRAMTASQSAEVFERLYVRRKHTHESDDKQATLLEPQGREQVDQAKVAAFLERQTQFLKLKEAKLTQLEDESRCSFSPELSDRTKQLSLERRAKPVSELLHDERLRRQRRLEKCIGAKVSLGTPASPTKKPRSITSHTFHAPEAFQALVLELQAQEQRMKALDLYHEPTGSPAGCAPLAACTRDRYSGCGGPASSARP